MPVIKNHDGTTTAEENVESSFHSMHYSAQVSVAAAYHAFDNCMERVGSMQQVLRGLRFELHLAKKEQISVEIYAAMAHVQKTGEERVEGSEGTGRCIGWARKARKALDAFDAFDAFDAIN